MTIQGNVKIDQWEGKDGIPHAQLRVHAKYIDFLNIGKKQEGANAAAWNTSIPRHSSISEIVLNEKFTLPERILLTY